MVRIPGSRKAGSRTVLVSMFKLRDLFWMMKLENGNSYFLREYTIFVCEVRMSAR